MSDHPLTIASIDHIVFNVRDVDASAAWYARVLGMVRHDDATASGEVRTSMRFGANKINLRPVDASAERWFTARTPTAGSADLCFLTTIHPNDVTAHFGRCEITIETGPLQKDGARGPICSVYVRDPDGNLIEVSSYR